MNNYRMSHSTFMKAEVHAERLRKEGAFDVRIEETANGWDVIWRQR